MLLVRSTQRFFILWVCFFATHAASLLAQTPKVGFVNSATIRERSTDYQNAKQRIESIVNDWKKQVAEQETAIQALEADIQKKRLIWSDAELREREMTLQRKLSEKEDFVRKKFNSGGEFDTLVIVTMKPIEAKIAAAIQEVGITEGYDYVWDKSTQPLLYANPRFDVTVKVMEKLGLFTDDLKAKLQESIDKIDREIKKAREELSPSAVRRRISKALDDAKKAAEETVNEAKKEFEGVKKDFENAAKDVKLDGSQPKDSTKPRSSTTIPRDGGSPKSDTSKVSVPADTTKPKR
jgi:Skp family chaperone for outer membrane proteins